MALRFPKSTWYIIIPLALLSYVSTSVVKINHAPDETETTATVLFYCNDRGDKIVAAGQVHKAVAKLIKKNLRPMSKYAKVEIVPAYNNINDVPPIEEAIELMKENYRFVFVAKTSKMVISNLVAHNIKNMADADSHVKHYNPANYSKSVRSLMKTVLNKNLNSVVEKFDIAPIIIDSFIPNTVYYAIDMKGHPVLEKYGHSKDVLSKMRNAWKKMKAFLF